jgi:formylmethanofuran dehydrogenase subunit E
MWRKRHDTGQAFPTDQQSAIDAEVQRQLAEDDQTRKDLRTCDYCGGGAMETTDLPDGTRICSSCFTTNLPALIEKFPELALIASEVDAPTQEPEAKSSSEFCSLCGHVYRSGEPHSEHFRTIHPDRYVANA